MLQQIPSTPLIRNKFGSLPIRYRLGGDSLRIPLGLPSTRWTLQRTRNGFLQVGRAATLIEIFSAFTALYAFAALPGCLQLVGRLLGEDERRTDASARHAPRTARRYCVKLALDKISLIDWFSSPAFLRVPFFPRHPAFPSRSPHSASARRDENNGVNEERLGEIERKTHRESGIDWFSRRTDLHRATGSRQYQCEAQRTSFALYPPHASVFFCSKISSWPLRIGRTVVLTVSLA